MNKVAVITGGSRGIGRGIALELAAIGFDLILNFVSNRQAAEHAAAQCRSRNRAIEVELCQADLTTTAGRELVIQSTREQFQRLDLLVNNAGVAPAVREDILDAGEENFDRVLSVNAKAPYFLTQRAARWMIELTQSQRLKPYSPKIVTISSISAYTASVQRGEYCMAKAALSMLTPLFAARLAEFGIGVYEIRPGIIATDMTAPVREKYDRLIEQGLTPIRRWGLPEDVGRAVAAIAQDCFPFSTGDVFNIDGGFHLRRL